MLRIFEEASGQQINIDKSSVFFSRNTKGAIKAELCDKLRFHEADGTSKYLGLPNIMGRKKTAIMGYLKERIQERVQGWDKQLLSKAGKEVLLKTVAQMLPNYAINVFLLPVELCKDMERVMCKFWWKNSANKEKGIHWLSWERLSKKKAEGGLGFRNLRDFNIALLGKQGWRLIQFPDSLVNRVFKARYYPNSNFLEAKIGGSPSYIWRSILEAQVLLKKGARRRVGSGKEINILNDPWLPNEEDPYVHTCHVSLNNKMVESLMIPGENQWDVDLVNDIFEGRDASLILSIHIRMNDIDSWFWSKEKLGHYSVRSVYSMIQADKGSNHIADNSGFWRKLWNLKVPPKVKSLLWRASTECLPTKTQLRLRKVDVNVLCPVCNKEPESIYHILVSCQFAKACWNAAGNWDIVHDQSDFMVWLAEIFKMHRVKEINAIVTLLWSLWKSMNDLV